MTPAKAVRRVFSDRDVTDDASSGLPSKLGHGGQGGMSTSPASFTKEPDSGGRDRPTIAEALHDLSRRQVDRPATGADDQHVSPVGGPFGKRLIRWRVDCRHS